MNIPVKAIVRDALLPKGIVIVNVIVYRLEHTFNAVCGEDVGLHCIEIGRGSAQDQVCQVVKTLSPGGFNPFNLTAILFLEGEESGVNDLILGLVVEVIIPGEELNS